MQLIFNIHHKITLVGMQGMIRSIGSVHIFIFDLQHSSVLTLELKCNFGDINWRCRKICTISDIRQSQYHLLSFLKIQEAKLQYSVV